MSRILTSGAVRVNLSGRLRATRDSGQARRVRQRSIRVRSDGKILLGTAVDGRVLSLRVQSVPSDHRFVEEVPLRSIADALVTWGPAGVLLLAVLDSAGIPLPTGVDALIVATSAASPESATLVTLLAVGGSLLGNLVLFSIARTGGRRYLERHLRAERARRFHQWFHRYGLLTVFIPGLVPIPLPMKVFVISAGALGVRLTHFLLVVLLARVPRYAALAYLGAKVGEHSLAYLKDRAGYLILFSAALTLFLILLIRLTDRLRAEQP